MINGEFSERQLQLGNTGISISPLGIGTWAWGDRIFWGYGKSYSLQDVKDAFQISLDAGINLFDTAEIYGSGQSERILGQFARECGRSLVIATKFMPFPWLIWPGALQRSLKNSLNRLRMDHVDLYQIHWPYPPISVETWARQLGEAVKSGLIRSAGVSNFNLDQMQRAAKALGNLGVPLASNQVRYSLLDRRVEHNELLDACHEMGVTLIAYSPLAQGLLTGKYSTENPPKGIRGRRFNGIARKIQPLIQLMREIGRSHIGITPAQVAINWNICKGTVPIPGAKNANQAKENVGALGWRLTEAEVKSLDDASQDL